MRDMIAVMNFDERYASAIAIKLRAEKIYCRIVAGDTPAEEVFALNPLGIVLAGAVSGDIPALLDGNLLRGGMPILALGDAAAAVCELLAGSAQEPVVVQDVETVRLLPSRITEGISQSERMLCVVRPLTLSDDMDVLAQYNETVIGFMHRTLPIFGFQFQIESNDMDGIGILTQFATTVCGCFPWWNEGAFISAAKSEIAEAVGEGTAICAMTGGLDSGVSAVLAHRAIGDRLHCLFVDSGLLRQGEADRFMEYYSATLGLRITRINAVERFATALAGLSDTDDKRVAISMTMQAVLDEASAGMDYNVIIRGTSANDILRRQDTVASPSLLQGKRMVQPLRELFKEEIRHVGEALGMLPEVYSAQPFPGSGLALRIIGEATPERLAMLREADAILREEIRQAGLHKRLWKYFAFMYHFPQDNDPEAVVIGLRAVSASSASGGMRALPARLPYDLLERCVERIMTGCPYVFKVFQDITPGSILSDLDWQ